MKIDYCDVDTCAAARGVVVAVDVVRAFTTAAYAFGAGARNILLAGTVEQALTLRERFPGALLMGESGGLPVPGFDLWNSPAQFVGMDLGGKTLVQRTSAGTQGIVKSTQAEQLFAASFAVAASTARALLSDQPAQVTFVITGESPAVGHPGPEDRACAEYIAALLQGQNPDPQYYMAWAETFIEDRLQDQTNEIRQAFRNDLTYCVEANRFPFALEVKRNGDLLVMEKRL